MGRERTVRVDWQTDPQMTWLIRNAIPEHIFFLIICPEPFWGYPVSLFLSPQHPLAGTPPSPNHCQGGLRAIVREKQIIYLLPSFSPWVTHYPRLPARPPFTGWHLEGKPRSCRGSPRRCPPGSLYSPRSLKTRVALSTRSRSVPWSFCPALAR